jgi:ERCC4-related helicase
MKDSNIKKVLVFANFEETLHKVISTLKTENIKYWRLMGTSKEITEIVNTFTDCTDQCVLVINSVKNCSGLNLQSATDLVYMHTIQDMNIEGQVAGRAFRIGRKNALSVWYLQFTNEMDSLYNSHNVRNLTEEELAFEKESEEKWLKGQKIKIGPDVVSPDVDDEEDDEED